VGEATDYREWLVQAHYKAVENYDRAVTVLAGGALGLSITFIHDIAPNPTHKGYLALAWLLFAFALLSTFVSHLTSQGVLLKRIKDTDAAAEWGRSYLGQLTTGLNICAAIGVIGGFVFLVCFALFNV